MRLQSGTRHHHKPPHCEVLTSFIDAWPIEAWNSHLLCHGKPDDLYKLQIYRYHKPLQGDVLSGRSPRACSWLLRAVSHHQPSKVNE
jgi:hypothetical protein